MFGIDDFLLGTIAKGAFSLFGQSRSQDFNAEQSATAFQRQRADIEAAGLNPALIYAKGGAGAPVVGGTGAEAPDFAGALAHSSTAKVQRHQENLIDSQALNQASQTQLNQANSAVALAQKDKIEAETRQILEGSLPNIQQDIELKVSQINLNEANKNNALETLNLIKNQTDLTAEQKNFVINQTLNELAKISNTEASTRQINSIIERIRYEIPNLIAQTNQLKGQLPLQLAQTAREYATAHQASQTASNLNLDEEVRRSASEFASSWWGRYISPYLNDILGHTQKFPLPKLKK